MAFKEILPKEMGRAKIKRGFDTGADVACVTIGPNGRNVMVDRGIVTPLITNDGFKAIQGIVLKDRVENMSLDSLKEIVRKTSESARGARTASILISRAMLTEGLKHIDENLNVITLKREISKVISSVVEELKKVSVPVSSIEDIRNVATISSESRDIGDIIAKALDEIGKDGVLTSEEVPTRVGVTYESAQGMKIDQGWIDSYFVTNYDKMVAEYSDVAVILVNKKLLLVDEIKDLLTEIGEKGIGEILLIAEDIQGEVLRMCIENKIRGGFKITAVKAPGSFGSNKIEILKDIACLTGATVLGDTIDLKTAKIDTVGFASKIIVGQASSTIVGNPDMVEAVKERIASLQKQKKDLKSRIDIDNVEDRISRLSGGAAIVKIGTATSLGANYTKDKIDDAITESKAAYEEGIVAGGGSALVKIASKMQCKENATPEAKIALEIVKSGLYAPLRQIMKNSGVTDIPGMVTQVENGTPLGGYDAVKNEIVDDMIKEGIIDAYKVVRIALENAAEGVGTLLTVEVVIADEPIINKQQ